MAELGPRSVAFCRHCGHVIVDGREDSGASEYDPMTLDGDFGCDDSPDTGEDGVGSHEPEVITKYDNQGGNPTDWRRVTETFTVLTEREV